MTLRLALRSLATQPIRSLVLAGGFGMGIAAMAGLLGVGEVILEQSRSPALNGGGDVSVTGAGGKLASARFLISSILRLPALAGRARAASPSVSTTLYLVRPGGGTLAVDTRGGIPSLERAIGDEEISSVPTWRDTERDSAWADPDPTDVLRAMDRFHPIPDVPSRAESWAEWLYFNGTAEEGTRFYLTYLVGRRSGPDRREALVRLQLEHDGRLVSFAERAEIRESELLAAAPDVRIGRSSVRLDGSSYRIHLELAREADDSTGSTAWAAAAAPDLVGDLVLEAVAGRSLPPLVIHGAGGWISGYVVPVLAGRLDGRLEVDGTGIEFVEAAGYHDHNWGFWEGVTWQWGQVAGDGFSLVFGRIRPPEDAADPERLPGFLIAIGPDGPLGHAIDVRIEEFDDPESAVPSRLEVEATGSDLAIRMTLDVEGTTRTAYRTGRQQRKMEFLQLRARYRVAGRIAEREVDFAAMGSAESFRGH